MTLEACARLPRERRIGQLGGGGGALPSGVHLDSRGRGTLDELPSVMASHDDHHLDQLARALEGRA